MVCHETYRDAGGNWLFPEEVTAGEAGPVDAQGGAVTVGRSEKMSKSKKNLVGLETIVEEFGADTARLYLLSDSPPERDLEWTDSGIEGAWRYVNRLWRLATNAKLQPPDMTSSGDLPARRAIHRTIAAVTDDFDKFRFNRAVARIRELTNLLEDDGAALPPAVLREGIETAVRLIDPMMPHLAEELWQALGHDTLLADEPWPRAESALLVEELVTVAVQVNGKLRATVELPRDADQDTASKAALALEGVTRAMAGKPARKVIVVPNRIVNLVV
jgi:leucyl-tRNA synthetase